MSNNHNVQRHRAFHDGHYYLNGTPFLVVGGELHNSSASTPSEIVRALDAASALGVETVLAPISWELVEPTEGQFDLSLVDVLVAEASSRRLHLIPLWFGSWKNGMSNYVPAWVKQDRDRFPRIVTSNHGEIEALSPFSPNSRDADARAFAAVMGRLAQLDDSHTVLMVQVENEVGVLGDARDHSSIAQAAWWSEVPTPLITLMDELGEGRLFDAHRANGRHPNGSWSESFGAEADEVFMAHAFASYLATVARAGKAAFDVPLLANAWLDVGDEDASGSEVALAGGVRPGEYPSGGPLRHTLPIWRKFAPELDVFAPDIYMGPFDEICRAYAAGSSALLIPEMRRDRVGIAQMFRAIGTHGAAGVSPFGIDSLRPSDVGHPHLADAYALLTALRHLLAEHPGAQTQGFILDAENPTHAVELDGDTIIIDGSHLDAVLPATFPGFGCIIAIGTSTFFAVGRGFTISVAGDELGPRYSMTATEFEATGGGLRVTRQLNGDECGEFVRLSGLDQRQTDISPIPRDTRSTGVVRVQYRALGSHRADDEVTAR